MAAQAALPLQPLGGAESCGGNGTIASLFESGVKQGLCEDVAGGFIGIFLYQLIAVFLLFLLSLLLPVIWHSHQLLPFTCQRPRLPRWHLSGVSMRNLHGGHGEALLALPPDFAVDAHADGRRVQPVV